MNFTTIETKEVHKSVYLFVRGVSTFLTFMTDAIRAMQGEVILQVPPQPAPLPYPRPRRPRFSRCRSRPPQPQPVFTKRMRVVQEVPGYPCGCQPQPMPRCTPSLCCIEPNCPEVGRGCGSPLIRWYSESCLKDCPHCRNWCCNNHSDQNLQHIYSSLKGKKATTQENELKPIVPEQTHVKRIEPSNVNVAGGDPPCLSVYSEEGTTTTLPLSGNGSSEIDVLLSVCKSAIHRSKMFCDTLCSNTPPHPVSKRLLASPSCSLPYNGSGGRDKNSNNSCEIATDADINRECELGRMNAYLANLVKMWLQRFVLFSFKDDFEKSRIVEDLENGLGDYDIDALFDEDSEVLWTLQLKARAVLAMDWLVPCGFQPHYHLAVWNCYLAKYSGFSPHRVQRQLARYLNSPLYHTSSPLVRGQFKDLDVLIACLNRIVGGQDGTPA